MAQMQTEQRHADEVKQRDPDIGKAEHHHSINIVPMPIVLQIDKTSARQINGLNLRGEVQEVVNNKT